MSKYNALWEYVQKNGSQSFRLTFEEIQDFAGISIDHSFLNYKKESGRQDFPERTDLAGILKTEFSGINYTIWQVHAATGSRTGKPLWKSGDHAILL